MGADYQSWQIHHLFVTCPEGASEGDALLALGFDEGPANHHPGQGTANRRFFFDRFYLELLYVTDRGQATKEPAARLRLAERCALRGSSLGRFGFALVSAATPQKPFCSTWDYGPSFMPEGMSIAVAENSTSHMEPLLFFPPSGPAHGQSPTGLGRAMRLTGVAIGTGAGMPRTKELESFLSAGIVVADRHEGVHLTFNGGAQGLEHDLSPALPLSISF